MQDLNAQANLHSRLLHKLFITVFRGDPQAFDALMDEVAHELATTNKKAEPASEEFIEDLKVRIAVHLVKFRASTREQL